MLAYYVHNLSPFLLRLGENFGIRWYGLAYLFGFIAGYFLIRSLATRGLSELSKEKVADCITLIAFFGVFIGGRLGYMLLYDWESFSKNPLSFFHFMKGGMASHGGIAGIILASLYFARRQGLSWLGVGDSLVVAAPLGLLSGRLANFVNGELYGRPSTVAWAVKFPTEIHDPSFLPKAVTAGLDYEKLWQLPMHSSEIFAALGAKAAYLGQIIETLTPRHPSQIYEALAEGLLLFIFLYVLRVRAKFLGHGILTGLFFIGYAVARISMECFREPDAEMILNLTRGQFYSLFMILIGAAFLLAGWFNSKKRNGIGTGKLNLS